MATRSTTSWGIIWPPVVTEPQAPPPSRRAQTTSYVRGRQAEFMVPQASVGNPVPYFVGRVLISRPNVLWYGNKSSIRDVQESTKSTTKIGVDGAEEITEETTITVNIVGYRISAQMSVGLGPDVQLLGIRSDDIPVWSGVAGTARTEFAISHELLTSAAIFHGGAFDQAPEAFLEPHIADLPGYVGLSYLILKSIRTDQLSSSLSVEARRVPNPLELDLEDNLSGDDVNVASAIVDVMTNGWGGRGISMDRVDEDSFLTAAETFAAEGQFCSFQVTSQIKATEMLKTLLDQAGAVMYPNRATDKMQIRLIRKSYYSAAAPIINAHQTVAIRGFNKPMWPATVEDMRVTYTDRGKNYEPSPVFMQVQSNFEQENRARRTLTKDYPTVFSQDLAEELWKRDFSEASFPVFSASFETTRAYAYLEPGQPVTVNLPMYRLFHVPAYVTRVTRLPLTLNRVIVEVQQLVMDDAVAYPLPPIEYDSPDLQPVPAPPVTLVRETPFFLLKRAGTVNSAQQEITRAYPMFTPIAANEDQAKFQVSFINQYGRLERIIPPSKQVATSDLSQIFSNLFSGAASMVDGANYPTSAKLENAIAYTDGFEDGVIPSVTVKEAMLFHTSGDEDRDAAAVRRGLHFVLIDDEILGYEDFESMGNDRYELVNVHRGLLDTVPQDHVADSQVFIHSNNLAWVASGHARIVGSSDIEYRVTSAVGGFRGISTNEFYDTVDWHPTYNRAGVPLRPHDTRIEGLRNPFGYALSDGDVVEVSWRTRNRDKNSVSLQPDATETGESVGSEFQTHRVFIVDSSDASHDCGATSLANENSLEVTVPGGVALGAGYLYVRSEIVIGGNTYVSHFRDRLPIEIVPDGTRVTEDGFARVTESGDHRVTE